MALGDVDAVEVADLGGFRCGEDWDRGVRGCHTVESDRGCTAVTVNVL